MSMFSLTQYTYIKPLLCGGQNGEHMTSTIPAHTAVSALE